MEAMQIWIFRLREYCERAWVGLCAFLVSQHHTKSRGILLSICTVLALIGLWHYMPEDIFLSHVKGIAAAYIGIGVIFLYRNLYAVFKSMKNKEDGEL